MGPVPNPFWASASPTANGNLTPKPGLSLLVPSATLGSCLLPGLKVVLPCPSPYPSQTLDPSRPCPCSMVGESGEGRGWLGSNKALADADCFLPPRLFSCCPARLLPPLPHPHPQQPQALNSRQLQWLPAEMGERRGSMPSACCCSGRPHHLTVWGQGRPHPSPSTAQGWAIPGMGPFCLRAQRLW